MIKLVVPCNSVYGGQVKIPNMEGNVKHVIVLLTPALSLTPHHSTLMGGPPKVLICHKLTKL